MHRPTDVPFANGQPWCDALSIWRERQAVQEFLAAAEREAEALDSAAREHATQLINDAREMLAPVGALHVLKAWSEN